MSLLIPLRQRIKRVLKPEHRAWLRQTLALRFRVAQHVAYSVACGSNLRALALLYGTDKWGGHWYCDNYDRHFRALRGRKLNILEIGVGGYEDPSSGGASLRMWRTYFPKATIHAIDIHDKTPHEEPRIKIHRGSQDDVAFLEKVCAEAGTFDIVIDDGSHVNRHVLTSFEFLFPRLSPSGIYVIEDTQTSYWKAFGGGSEDLSVTTSTKGRLKSLVDGLDFAAFERPGYVPTYQDENIVGLHFYPNMVFVEKGRNREAPSLFA